MYLTLRHDESLHVDIPETDGRPSGYTVEDETWMVIGSPLVPNDNVVRLAVESAIHRHHFGKHHMLGDIPLTFVDEKYMVALESIGKSTLEGSSKIAELPTGGQESWFEESQGYDFDSMRDLINKEYPNDWNPDIQAR